MCPCETCPTKRITNRFGAGVVLIEATSCICDMWCKNKYGLDRIISKMYSVLYVLYDPVHGLCMVESTIKF